MAHFDHAVRDRVVEADLPEALLRESGARTREISHEIICRLAGPYRLHPRLEGESATGVSCCCLVALEATRWREWSWWHRSAVPGASTPPAASKKPAQHAQVTYRSEAQEGSAVPLLLASWRFSNVISCPRLTVELHRASLGPSTAEPLVGRAVGPATRRRACFRRGEVTASILARAALLRTTS